MATDFTGKIFGSYKLVAQLGRGGMASVYRGYQESIDRSVAVKILPPEYLHDPNFAERFVSEARMLAKLVHPSILSLYDFGTAYDVPYIVMPLMAHGTLGDRMGHGPMSVAEVLRVITPIASALDYAHKQGVIHRDLKPSNILFDQNDTPFLGDFGIAKALEATSGLTGTGIIGTPDYMSPEQAQGTTIDGRSDLYALAVVVYQMLTGQQLFRATTPMGVVLKHVTEAPPSLRLIRPELPEALDAILNKALNKRPEDRYQTAQAFVAALTAAAGQMGAAATDQAMSGDQGTLLKPMAAVPTPRPVTPTPPPGQPYTPPPGQPITPPPYQPVTPLPSQPYTPPPPSRPVTPPPMQPVTPYPPYQPVTPPPGQAYTPPPPAAKKKGGLGGFLLGGSIGAIVAIVVVILLMVACCVGLIIAMPTSTPTPKPGVSKMPEPSATPPDGVLFADDFSDPNNGWEVSANSEAILSYVDDEYSIQGLETGWFIWSNPSEASYSDVSIEVKAKDADRTADVLFGVMCGFQDNQHYYYLGIDTAGNYLIAKHTGADTIYLTGGGLIKNSTNLTRGGNWYNLRADCAASGLALYVDGVLIDSVVDTDYQGGNIGLFLNVLGIGDNTTKEPRQVDVRFDDITVTELTEPVPTPQPSATPQAALFSDDFSTTANKWTILDTKTGKTGFADDQLFIRILTSTWMIWNMPGKTFSNIHLDVTAQNISGKSDTVFGVICNLTDTYNFYYGAITPGGYYAIIQHDKKNGSEVISGDGKWQQGNVFAQDAASYRLGLDCGNGAVTLYVDGAKIVTTKVTGLGEGDVGLLVNADKSFPAEVRFDDVVVTALP